MARNFDTTPLNPTMAGCAPACPPRPGVISPIISVTSVNGESGDVVLKGLVVGDKFYNGSSIVTLDPGDLGLQKAFRYQKELRTVQAVEAKMADAEVGDIYYCMEDTLFYISIGEGGWKTFGSGEHFRPYSKIMETASKIEATIDEDFMLTLDLFDKFGHKFFTSEPVEIPFEFAEIIKTGYYDAVTKELVFVLKNEKEIRVPVAGLIDGLQKEITDENPLEFRLVRGLVDFRTDIYDKLNAETAARADADSAEAVARQNAIVAASQQLEAKIAAERDARLAEVAEERKDRSDADTAIRNDMNSAVSSLREDLTNETSARITKDSELQDKLDEEIIARKHADTVLTEKLNTEIADRKEADATEKTAREADTAELANRIAIEKQSRIDADAAEKTAREADTAALLSKISAEETARIDSDTQLTTSINNVQNALTQEINTRTSEVSTLTQNLAAEIAERFDQDQAIKLSLNTEKATREARDIEIEGKLSDETAARISADNVLAIALNDEATDRANADLLEKQARESADTLLQQNIDNEAATRESSDNLLRSDLTTERANRINNDADIRANLATEVQNRTDADIVLQSNINTEAQAREAADANLQDQIDRLPTYGMIKDAEPSSTEFVATYHLTITKDGVTQNVGTPINIAKDFLVKEAHLRTVTEDDKPYPGARIGDKYIDLVINVKSGSPEESHIYLPVKDLVDVYTGGYGITVEGYNIRLSDEFTHRVTEIEEHLKAERQARISADEQLGVDITNEATTRQQEDTAIRNDYRSLITTETTARQEADSALQVEYTNLVSNEATTRAQKDAEIVNNFNNALTAEVNARTEADAAIRADYNSKLAAESETRSNADSWLQNQITKNKADIANEIVNRESADASLYALILDLINKKNSYVTTITGNGSLTSFNINHSLNSMDVMIQLYDTEGKTILTDSQRTSKNTAIVSFQTAPADGVKYTVMCNSMSNNLVGIKIAFDANGGTGDMSPRYIAAGTSLTLPECLFTAPVGKEFDKWAIGSISGEQHLPGESYTFTESTTVYALWREALGTFYYGAVPVSVLTAHSIDALNSMTATHRSAADLLINGAAYEFDLDNTVPVFAVNDNLNITCNKFWTTDESYTIAAPYTYTVDSFTFFCDSTDAGATPSPALGQVLCGMSFKEKT